jgi:hypothetical protein
VTALAVADTVWVDWQKVPVPLRRAAYKGNWGLLLPHPRQARGGLFGYYRVPKAWVAENGLEEAVIAAPSHPDCPACQDAKEIP